MIIPMKRLTLVAHKADEAEILKALQRLSAVEVIPEEEAAQTAAPALDEAEQRVQRLTGALNAIKPYAAKRSMLSPLPETTVGQIVGELPEAMRCSKEVEQLQREISGLRAQIEKNLGLAELLEPWMAFPADMQAFRSAKTVRYFTGMLAPADYPRLAELGDAAEYQSFGDGAELPVLVACRPDDAKAVASFLKSLSWTDVAFPRLAGTPAEAHEKLLSENRELQDKLAAQESLLAEKGAYGELLRSACDAAVIERDRALAAAELSRTAATFELHGWVPENRLSDVERAVAGVTDAYCLFTRDPNDDETPPSVVKNNRFVTPFEVVTDLYSRPDPRGMDPTPFMAIPYIILFGLMLSDSGYGLLLAIGCALFIRLRRPTGMMGGLARVLLWGGLSTIIWGVLVGTVFGLDFDVLLGTDDLFPIILDPMTDPIGMLILCFGLGVVHILFGYGLRVKESFAQGDWQGAVFDTLSWMFIIVGLIAGVGGPMVGLGFLQYPGLILAGIGALLILLFKGRGKRNPIKRTISGLGELYNISGVLSDILSYARLFALGIATGVIASVFNDICSMLMGSPNIILKILGVAVACALLVGLHLFNLAINTLGAFVHCARLQYVEFYGKFYEAGGRTFRPLGYKTKHVQITEP